MILVIFLVSVAIQQPSYRYGFCVCTAFRHQPPFHRFRITKMRMAASLSDTRMQPRTVPLGIPSTSIYTEEPLAVTIWELSKPSDLVQQYWSLEGGEVGATPDPFGVVMWPGSIVASQEMARQGIQNKTILIIGAGTGVEAQAAVLLGASHVIATDVFPLTLKLLEYGARQANISDRISTQRFDLFSNDPLPDCDVMVVADVIYNERLGAQIGVRCEELLTRPTSHGDAKLIVTDSQRFDGTDFVPRLNKRLSIHDPSYLSTPLQWKEQLLENVTGSGVLIEEDQTYNVTVRLLSVGWDT
jgi:predicted nicotinamide N-methyase